MNHTMPTLRLIAQRKTKWSPEDRDRTIEGFLSEITQAVAANVIEHLAEHNADKLETMFIDWVQYRTNHTYEERIRILVTSVAKVTSPVPFALDSLTTEEAEPQPVASNVVPLLSMR